LWQLGKWDEAAKAYDDVARLDPRDTEAIKHAAAARDISAGKYTAQDYEYYRMQLGYGDLKDKRAALRIVITRSPKFFAAQLLLGKVAFMLSDFETSYGAYLAGHKLEPGNLECADGVARAAMRTERYDDALRYFQEVNKLEKNYEGGVRWEGIVAWVAAGGPERKRAFKLWLEASAPSIDNSARRKLLEEAVNFEPDFAEALVDLAGINRNTNAKVAENFLLRALTCARDDDTRAAAHREYGRLKLSQNKPGEAIGQFESAYETLKSDGTDMLLIALCWRDLDKQSEAAAAMRKLFAEVPGSGLLRPSYNDVLQLDLAAVQADGPRALSPAYDIGDKLGFAVRIEVEGKGGGQLGKELSLEYDLNLQVLEKPMQNGVWRLKLSFANVPDEFNALEKIDTELKISPWFGLLAEPELGDLGQIANPAIQAIAEGLTAGLGDAVVAPPYIWTNDLTAGPPHFGGAAVEGSCLQESLGDSFTIMRRGLAGRQLGRGEDQHNYSRALEARVSCGGSKRSLREVEFQILIKELTPEKDDVKFSRLYCRIAAK
jgi:tetratricopeptide (TPR) repeat protein